MDLYDYILAAALIGWMIWAVISSRRMLRRINSGSIEAWAGSMRWGFLAGGLFALAACAPETAKLAAGQPMDSLMLLILPVVGLASGPGFAFFLYQNRQSR